MLSNDKAWKLTMLRQFPEPQQKSDGSGENWSLAGGCLREALGGCVCVAWNDLTDYIGDGRLGGQMLALATYAQQRVSVDS